MKVYVAIDPDAKGYICAIAVEHGALAAVRFHPLPMVPATDRLRANAKGYTLNVRAFRDMVRTLEAHEPNATVAVEQSQSWPGMGGASAFRYGMLFGRILTTLDLLDIAYRLVRPARWWTDLDLPIHRGSVSHNEKRKWREKVLAQRIADFFPSATLPLRPRAGTIQPGAASAFAMAWWLHNSATGRELLDPTQW